MKTQAKLWIIVTFIVAVVGFFTSTWHFKPSTPTQWSMYGVAVVLLIAIDYWIYKHTKW